MYVIFEGIDGCGKTTITRLFADQLELRNITPILLREPSRGRYGQAARALMRDGVEPWRPELRRLLTLDRQEHVSTKIRPALALALRNPGFALVQDRGYLSAPAYNVQDDGGVDAMLEEQRAVAPLPDRFFVIDVPVDVATRRINARSTPRVGFEGRDFLSAVQARYLRLANDPNEPITVLDGTLDPLVVVQEAIASLDSVK